MEQNSLLVDLLNGLGREELLNKHGLTSLNNLSIQRLIDDYKRVGGSLNDLIDTIWYGDPRDKKAYYLMRYDNGFEVFLSERGGKHWRKTFTNLESATFHLVDSCLNGYGIAAIDSLINK